MPPIPAGRRPLPELIASLVSERRSGRLRLRSDGGDRTLFFVRGTPTLATSGVAGERIGETLVRRGLLPSAELEPMVAAARAAGRRFDAHLVAIGRVDVETARRLIGDLAYQVLAALLRDGAGEPLFTALDRPVDDDVRIGRPTAVVWSLALERIPDERVLREIAGERREVDFTADPFPRLGIVPLDDADVGWLAGIDGRTPAVDLAARHPSGERRGLRLLGALRLSGLIRLRGESPPPARTPHLPFPPPLLFPWNRDPGEDQRRGARGRFRPAELVERERVLSLIDRAGDGLEALGMTGEAFWRGAALLHPDHAHRDLFHDLGPKLHFLFPRLFETGAPKRAAPDVGREERILRRKLAAAHAELAQQLLAGSPGRAYDLLVRAAELDPARAELAERIAEIAAREPWLAGDGRAAPGAPHPPVRPPARPPAAGGGR